MPEEANSHPGMTPAPVMTTQSFQAEDAPNDGEADEPTSKEGVHPDDKPPGDEEVFHEEGGKKFKTKDEYITHVNKQRGAASRLASENNRLAQEMATKEAELQALRSVKKEQDGKAPAAAPIDPEVQAAITRLKQDGKFITSDDIKSLVDEVTQLREMNAQISVAGAAKIVESFIAANPKADGAKNELAEIMTKHNLSQDLEGLRLAYLIHFREEAKDAGETKAQADARSERTSIKRAQAGGGPRGSSAGTPSSSDGIGFNWGKLRE